ncbi:PREDICTED: uncharacterized protein LOC105456464 [Wasmannia auropunctata]|uniref:uncharacterized protein LOC105456464 n=1 Tax=Wasmannia auropunctata TaxID=64793 RepID=UPI0005EF0CBD|nr:PREDICTED: uncharacterized protein LOC105456464 [Wasmannia auropunctata]
MEVAARPPRASAGASPAAGARRWALKKMDPDMCQATVVVGCWADDDLSEVPLEEDVRRIQEIMRVTPNFGAPLSGSGGPTRVPGVEGTGKRIARAYEVLRAARGALRLAIRKAKAGAWADLIADLDNDPCGHPYRLVLNKLKSWTPPTTETLEPQFLERGGGRVPNQRAGNPPARRPPCYRRVVGGAGGDGAGVGARHSELRDKLKAPGPDSVPSWAWVLAADDLGDRLRHLYTRCFKEGRRWCTSGCLPVWSPPWKITSETDGWSSSTKTDSRAEGLCRVGFRRGPSRIYGTLHTTLFCGRPFPRGPCYADDTFVLAGGADWGTAVAKANHAVAGVVRAIEAMGLQVAPQKTEVLFFHDGFWGGATAVPHKGGSYGGEADDRVSRPQPGRPVGVRQTF